MADDLTIVASLLRDTNNKLDKLHTDNVQDDTPIDIIKDALPEVLSDRRNTKQVMEQSEKHEQTRQKSNKTLDAINSEGIKQSKIFTDLKKPMTDLGLAVPSGFNAFSKKADEITAEKSLPSDFKLMLQALTPKALTEGFKVGLGDMFKELGHGVVKIGSGMKSLATKGLTAAQRKSEEKEKESKEKKKDGFFKNQFGKITGFLGGILKTAQLAGKAGFLALLGAGAVFALAKLIESPYWNTVAGIVEYGLNKIIELFEFMDEQFGPAGVLATALAGWYGTKGILTLAGMAAKALGKKFLGKLGLTAATKAATTALGATGPAGLGLLAKLGLLGLGLTAAATAMVLLTKAADWFNERAAKAETKILNDLTKDVDKQTPEEQQRRKDIANDIASRRNRQRTDDPLVKEQIRKANEAQRVIAAAAKRKLEQKPPVDAAVYGGSPAEIRAIIAKSFKEAIAATHFEGSAKNRLGQLKELFGGVSSKLLGKEFQALDAEKKSAFLKLLRLEEQSAFQSIRSGGKSKFGGQSSSTAFRAGLDKKDERELMLGVQAARKSLINLRKEQIEDPSIIPEFLKLQEEAKQTNRLLLQMMKDDSLGETNAGPSFVTTNVDARQQTQNHNAQGSLFGQHPDAFQYGF